MDAKKLNLGGATAQNRQRMITELRTQFTPRSSWRIFGVKGKYQLRCAGAAPNMRFLGSSPGCPPCELHLLLCHSLNRVQRTLPTTLWIALEAGGGSLFALCGLIGLRDFSCRIQERYLRSLRRKYRPSSRSNEGRCYSRSEPGRRVRFANKIERSPWATWDERIGSVRSAGWWNLPS